MYLEASKNFLQQKTYDILNKAYTFSVERCQKVKDIIERFLSAEKLDESQLCFIVIGSYGRMEALEASDFDIIPVLKNGYSGYTENLDKKLRSAIKESMQMNVSNGDDLTKPISIENLSEVDSIGGDSDSNTQLTKRINILTEGYQVAGQFDIKEVKAAIIQGYSNYSSTRGRHTLSLCNDLARYYRTLCIEYKGKVDAAQKNWCIRNAKLRHSRKVWYFSSLMTLVFTSGHTQNDQTKTDHVLLAYLSKPPIGRLFDILDKRLYPTLSKLLEYHAWFLDFMSNTDNRQKLEAIEHDKRYETNNDFYVVKLNSDMLHNYICDIIYQLDPYARQKVIDWFLL